MRAAGIGKKEWIVLGAALLMLFGLYKHYGNIQDTAVSAMVLSGAAISVYFILDKTYWFYLSLVALIPLSMDLDIGRGAQVNSPSELMILPLLAVLLLFHKDYSTALGKTLRHPIAILLAVDIFWQLIVTLTSSHQDVSVKRWIIHTVFILGFFTTVTMLKNPRKLLKVWMAYVIGLVPVMWYSFDNFRINEFNPRSAFVISKPFFPDHTVYGACIAFIIPLLILLCLNRKRLNWKKWQITGLFLITLIAVVSEFIALSRAAILSLVVALIFALLLHWKMRFKMLLLGLAGIGLIVFSMQREIYEYFEETDAVSNDGQVTNHLSSVTNIQTDASNLERVNRWVCAVRMFEDRPIFGYGPGTYQFEYNKFQTTEYKTYISSNKGDKGNAHSEYLTYLSEKGILGGAIFLLIVFSAIYFGMKNHLSLEDPLLRLINLGILLGLVTYFFHGIFNSFMDQSKMAFLYFTGLGTLVWLSQRGNRDYKNDQT
ncbi:MAG: O-antigen ligase family protein [bacterium]|nr:O-antigen ligase family protein [bacterium]